MVNMSKLVFNYQKFHQNALIIAHIIFCIRIFNEKDLFLNSQNIVKWDE